ncbi:MAG TPA: lysylphosphatidylglycerol synthase domain-containing protein, partial [Solirubrobacteraceae bacterium]|nr:lysylphosphatidylglycerol synthase domain-containing protein [Solirubrobacteraceae bacterium]
IGYMTFDVLALWAAFEAFGGAPPAGPFVFAYVIGQLGGLIPLPGGIGGTDGGLIGALVLYGAPLSQATAAVLAYRAFQLGIPALLGTVAFVQLRRRLTRHPEPAALCFPLADS